MRKRQTISVSDAAKIKDCSKSTIYRWIHQGKIEGKKLKGKWQIAINKKWEVAKKRQSTQENSIFPVFPQSSEEQEIKDLKEHIYILEWVIENLEQSCGKFCFH